MACLWPLVVLTWGLLVLGREQEDETALFEEEPKTEMLDDDGVNSNDYDDDDDDFPDPDGVKTLEPEPVKGGGATLAIQEEFVGSPPRGWTSTTDPSQSGLRVTCDDEGFRIFLVAGQFSDVKVLGSEDTSADHTQCGLNVSRFENTLTVPFTGCHVETTNGYSLQLLYEDEFGEARVATVSCRPESAPGLQSRAGVPPGTPASRCRTPPPPQTPPRAQHCAVAPEEQLPCGHSGILPADCETKGCCVNPFSYECYYPMDECTVDLHFVFIIRSTYTSLPLNPTHLVIPGTDCKPVVVNVNFAIFKFKVTECGTRTYDIGMTRFYLAEVQTLVRALNLKYGIITRTDPLRFLVECRYHLAARDQQPFASVGYMVKIPSRNLPSSIPSDGLYGVQLRIATDKTFSTFLPSFPTLRYILGKPVYLELSILSPKPNATILVKYCLAYPRSATNALVLVYEGCANPNDPNVAILQVSNLQQNCHQRHFEVKAFQFMDVKTKRYLDEQIHFMCSSEVCWSDEKTCEEPCFDGKVP
ncbi:zona pellucida sperm-binding protein 4-like [Phyllopteryx taeniolatus]|uniref:zona pellucida sperm-binding protein 4-like n=1 Tax=Phyllopteryx taeniolatus TaxID=161469 RepID=UPI002AD51B26|nr:zona pellucida sperm-binding protein 4-like [Phyllopteryx taeniolatus]